MLSMAFKKSYALKRGTWSGTPYESDFTQDETVFASIAEFLSYVDENLLNFSYAAYNNGYIIRTEKMLSPDGKMLYTTKEFIDEASHDAYINDSTFSVEEEVTKVYTIQLAEQPEDVDTFDEVNRIYYTHFEHLF